MLSEPGWGQQLCPPHAPLAPESAQGQRLAARTAEEGPGCQLRARLSPGRIPREPEEGHLQFGANEGINREGKLEPKNV